MKFTNYKIVVALSAFAVIASCSKESSSVDNNPAEATAGKNFKAEAIVIKASGEITEALNEYRVLLGNLNSAPAAPGTPGLTSGRREVNWDGVAAPNLNNANFPGDFFGSFNPLDGNGRKRGIIFSTPGTGLRVSDNDLGELDLSYPLQFDAFSPTKTFIAEGSTITDVFFKVPGQNLDATVNAFGVVFSDVDHAASTSILFYHGSDLLGEFKAPRKGLQDSFSFLGVYFPDDLVTHVRIISGTDPLAPGVKDISEGGGKDLVAMDDFIYSEPRAF